jgi:SAM-dependent methyltransferase
MNPLSIKELKELYSRGVNIMGLFREAGGTAQNSTDAILVAYDLQAGSYVQAAHDPAQSVKREIYAAELAAVLDPLGAESMLEAGVGEATTLCTVLGKMNRRPAAVAGFDISWSRLAYGAQFARETGVANAQFFTGDLFRIPVVDDAFDVVYTAHSIEPNHGREGEVLQELYRIARRWLVLFEPSYELGSAATRQRIEEHGYCRGLPEIARGFGWEVTRHELLQHPIRENNQTAMVVIRKEESAPTPPPATRLGCPQCRAPLASVRGHHFCEDCGRVYPVLDGIPCLLAGNGILASKFQEVTPE